MKYFERTYNTAQSNFTAYWQDTNFQRSNIAFGAAGNLSKAASNRLSTIRNVSHEKQNKAAIRKAMLDLYRLIVEPELCKAHHWAYLGKWQGIDSIIEQFKMCASWTDKTDYWQAILSNSCIEKIEVMKYFIERYGSRTDKKIFIPLMTLNPYQPN